MKNDTTPATKADISTWEDEIRSLRKAMQEWKQEIIRHFDVVLEDLRHDLLGVNRDEIELLEDAKGNHDQRITRLEKHVGIVV